MISAVCCLLLTEFSNLNLCTGRHSSMWWAVRWTGRALDRGGQCARMLGFLYLKITTNIKRLQIGWVHSGARIFKKSRPKKTMKSNKRISWNFILTKFHFLQFQKWPNINFWTGEKFITAKNAISREFFFISWLFFAWTFLNFLASTWGHKA